MPDTGFVIPETDPGPASGASGGRYRAFGMIISSQIPFPEFEGEPGPGAPDVVIRLRPPAREGLSQTQSTYAYGEEEQFLHWPGVGGFLICGGNRIDVSPAPGASWGLIRLPLLGPVMALLMHQRERLVLHASAVRIRGRLVIFAGDKGAGKSTTTAAAVERGHSLFTDDLLPVVTDPEAGVLAYPGFPSLKLVSDCAPLFGLQGAAELDAPVEGFPKHIRRLSQPFSHEPAKPSRIYILHRAGRASTSRLPQAEALRMIMRFAYIPLFRSKPWSPGETRRHFSQCAALAAGVTVARLETPSELGRLSDIIDCIEADLAGDTA